MKILLDSDFLYGLSISEDFHHKKSLSLFKVLLRKQVDFIVLNLVVQETATVISRKRGQKDSVLFLEKFSKLPSKILRADEDIEDLAWKIFRKQTERRTSFIDCANLAVCEKYKFDGIASFDKFYPEKVRIK